MNTCNLYVEIIWKEAPVRHAVTEWRQEGGGNELHITVFGQSLWVKADAVKLHKGRGSTFCWHDHSRGQYVELTEKNEVCPVCGWWICHVCASCRCNKP